jgi:lipid-A-disaccharide synthase
MARPLKVALVAGEASGDQLGGKLIHALREQVPEISCFGVGGDHMRTAGFDAWWDRRELSVMGLFEVARHLPRLLRLRRELLARLLEAQPDVVIGIDAPDFNLGLEKRLKQQGLRTVHYVSPTVWAWREGRAAKIGAAADLVLCLFPFEPPFYADHGVSAAYTGHPMADAIENDPDPQAARFAIGLPQAQDPRPLIALLPGSRASEVGRLATPMLEAAVQLSSRPGGARFVAALAEETTAAQFSEQLDRHPALDCHLVIGRALDVMAAADIVMCASGTATLETLLVNRPMVVTYRLAESTYRMARSFNLIKTRFIALPNILANERLVPELIQDEANGPAIAQAVNRWLEDDTAREQLKARFAAMHEELRRDAAASAASAVLDLVGFDRET